MPVTDREVKDTYLKYKDDEMLPKEKALRKAAEELGMDRYDLEIELEQMGVDMDESIKESIESDKNSEEIVNSLLEKKSKGDYVKAFEGDEVKLKDGQEYQLFAHPFYNGREPIAIDIGQEDVHIRDQDGSSKVVPITKVTHVMSVENGDRNFRKVEMDWEGDDYGESGLVYAE